MSIYRFMAPNAAGCNGKISYEETLGLRADLADSNKGVLDYFIEHIGDGSFIASSIDNTGRFCSDLYLFAASALNHAARDLLNAKPHKIIANVHFAFGNDLRDFDDKRKLVNAVATACKSYGITLGKCHSSQAEVTQLCISLIGAASSAPQFIPPSGGEIFLSHPLGAFRQIFLAEQGHPMAHYDEARRHMEMDYRSIVEDFDGKSIMCSDVSGFGLSGTLVDVALKHALEIEISYASLPFFAVSEDLKTVECLQSDQPKELEIRNDPHRIINLREIAGPIAIFAPTDEHIERLVSAHCINPIRIGKFNKSLKGNVAVC